jgi:hypothetical protein
MLVAFCKQKQMEDHVAYSNVRRDFNCYFHLVKPEDVDRTMSQDCTKISKCCSMHSMAFIFHRDCTLLNMQDLAGPCLLLPWMYEW